MQTLLKKGHHYQISITEETNSASSRTLTFQFQDREDMFNVVDKLKQGSGLTEDEAVKVGVALRLLGPVMMKNRKHALFATLMPHFKNFMHHLKTTIKNAVN